MTQLVQLLIGFAAALLLRCLLVDPDLPEIIKKPSSPGTSRH